MLRRIRAFLTFPQLDVWLLAFLFMLMSVGLITLYSAASGNIAVVQRQVLRFILAMMLLIVMAKIPPRTYMKITPWLYTIGVLLLVAVLLFGQISKGAQRWLNLGVVRFQPSELMKIATPLMVAWWFRKEALPPSWFHLMVGMLLVAFPMALIIKQPDLGTALVVGAAGGFTIFIAGISWVLIVGAVLAVAAVFPFLWKMLHEYQRERILTLFSPERDPLGSGYHIIQSKIAIGSGGLFGKGWMQGTQSNLDFIPERTTDFILAVYSEEFGWVGIMILLSLFGIILSRSFMIANRAQENFTRLVAASVTFTFFVYMCVNMGMVSGILPVVGLPLPLLSFGGTSLVTIMASFGILMSINAHRTLMTK